MYYFFHYFDTRTLRLFFLLLATMCSFAIEANAKPIISHSVYKGCVSYETSRSIYISTFDDSPFVQADTDSILAGRDIKRMKKVYLKTAGETKVVIERDDTLREIKRGDTLYVAFPNKNNKADNSHYAQLGPIQAVDESYPVSFKGRASVQYYRYDFAEINRVYDQPSVFIDSHYSGLGGMPLRLNLRFRTQMLRELEVPDYDNPEDQLRDRIYDLSAEYGVRDSELYVSVGRMRRIRSSGMGGLDGVVIERRLFSPLTAGLFAGIAPEMEQFLGARSAYKRGFYLHYDMLNENNTLLSLTSAYINEEYPDIPTVNLLYIGQRFRLRNTIIMFNEAAFNTTPKGEEREGETLQNIRSYISYSPLRQLRFSMSYFAYLIPEYQSYYDRFIDPQKRLRYSHNHTVMPSVHITLPWKMNVSGETLFAAGPKEKNKLLSAALRFNKYGLPAGIRLGASQIETFGENRISGHHTILSTSKTFMQSLDMRLQGGFAKYEFIYSQAYWEYDIRTSIFHNMASSWYYSVSYDRTWGDVKPSNQYFVEIGTRFGK